MSDVTPMGISWPDEYDDPFQTEIEDTYIGIDRIREDEDCVMVGGGTVTLVTDTLTWTSPFYIYSPRAGTFVTISANNITITDGQHLYFTPSARPIVTESSSFGAGSTVPAASVWCGTRSGSNLFFRSTAQKQDALTGTYPGSTPTQGAMTFFSSSQPTVLQQSDVWVMDDDTIVGYKAENDANPYIEYGSSATNRFRIQDIYDIGAQTLKHVLFETVTTGSYGDIKFAPAGNFIVKASSGNKIFSGTNSSDVEKTSIDENGHLTLSDGIYEVGKSVEVDTKNKSQIYIEDSSGNVLSFQNYYWNGSSWSPTYGYNFGHGAGQSSEGHYCNSFGKSALEYNEADYSNGLGYQVMQYNKGFYVNGCGHIALRYNEGDYSDGFGYGCLQYNLGDYADGFGKSALEYNEANYVCGFGRNVLQYNKGDHSNGLGLGCLQYNLGNNAFGGGRYVGQYNTALNFIGIGYYTAQYATCTNAIIFGAQSSTYLGGSDNINIGYNICSSFIENTSGNKNFDYTDIDAGTDQITVTGHSFGSNGTYHNIKYTEGTSPITGLTDGDIIQVYIVDANTIQVDRTHDITAAGSGTGHTLTPQYEYTNSIVIGSNQDQTASNQVILGNSSVTQTLLRGDIIIETKTPSSASDTGTTGTICWDSSYLYVCVATDTWKRAAISTW